MSDAFLMISAGLVVFGVAAGTRCFGLISPASLGDRILQHYRGARARGLTTQQAADELRMREVLARVRNRASEAVMRARSDGCDIIRWAIEAEAERLDPRIRRHFIAWASALSAADILTGQAFDVAMRAGVAQAASVAKWCGPRSDADIALRIK